METSIPLMLTQVNHRKLSLNQLVRISSVNPAKAFGLYPQKGSLHPGADADITIVSTTGVSSFGSDLSNLFDVNNDFWFDIAICSDSAAELQY